MQKEKQLIPQLRFSEFDKSWEIITLGEICKIQTGNKDTQDKEENGLYPFYVRSNTIERINSYSFDEEAILTSGDGAGVGKIYHLVNGKFNLHQRVYALTNFKTDFSIEYTYHFFSEKFYKRVMRLSAKNSVDSVRRDMIFDMKMPHPKLEEQQKIANFLTAIDTQIQTLEKKKTLLEQYKKGIMQKIFKQELRFKDDDGNVFPKWIKIKLGDILIEVNEKTTVSNQHTILSSTAKGLFNQSDYFTRDIASKDNTGYKILRKEQLVFSPQNLWLGNININCDFEVGIVSPSYKIFDFNKKLTSFNFCKYLLFTNRMFYEYAQASEQGASVVRRNLDMSSFKAIPIKLPSIKEQTKIANFLSAIDENITLVNTKIEQTKAYKKGLLQQMFV